VSFAGSATGQAFELTATPCGSAALPDRQRPVQGRGCGALTLNQAGARGRSGSEDLSVCCSVDSRRARARCHSEGHVVAHCVRTARQYLTAEDRQRWGRSPDAPGAVAPDAVRVQVQLGKAARSGAVEVSSCSTGRPATTG